MSHRLPLLLCLLACAFGAAACGGGDDDGDVGRVLSDTFGKGKEVKSGRLGVTLKLDLKGIPQLAEPVSFELNGPFESTGKNQLPRFDFNLGVNGRGQSFEAGAVSTGDKGFLRFGGQAYAVSEALFKQFRDGYAQQAKCNEGRDGGVSFQTLGIDPRRWLAKPRNAGTEEVAGTQAIHIASELDVPRFLEDVNRVLGRADVGQDPCEPQAQQQRERGERPRQLSAAERKQIADAIESAKVDIWTGEEDRTLRRLNVQLRLGAAQGGGATRGLQGGNVGFDLQIGALNEKQEIRAPADAKPLDQLLGQGGIPGLPGGGGTGGGGQAPGGQAPGGDQNSAPPAGNQEYLQCLERAGNDVAEIQKCAELLNG
jgi:hypothetical protein